MKNKKERSKSPLIGILGLSLAGIGGYILFKKMTKNNLEVVKAEVN